MTATATRSIADMNDEFRRGGMGMVFTQGVNGLPGVAGLVEAIWAFDEWTVENDPYGEHDFGMVMWHGEKVFWKIDYYDRNLRYWEDPLLASCRRVMTVMLASEY